MILSSQDLSLKGWQMVKSETHRDAEILVRNPSPILFGEKFRDSKKVKTNHEEKRGEGKRRNEFAEWHVA